MSLLAILTAALAALTLVGCVYLFVQDPDRLSRTELVNLGVFAIPRLAAFRLIALVVIFLLPAAAVTTANLEVIEGAQTVAACGGCHIMNPMITDMTDPESDSLAARHYRGPAASGHECYSCHSGYGFNGALAAKLEGYRHLVRYTTGLYPEPVRVRGHFDSASCLGCHEGTQAFEAVNSHRVVREAAMEPATSCLNCHGLAHPSRTQRTPGSPDYDRLMGRVAG